MKKLFILLSLATILFSCGNSTTLQYSLFDKDIPNGYIYEIRNGYLYCANDTSKFIIKTPCELYHIGNYFNYTYKVGEEFRKDKIKDKIIEWRNK